jgi:ligand-binding sensor domain-containing protein/signal transduction histidine kinase/CheY-like chemotaxis protein/AraC-like DNA-binding protein
MLTNAFMKFAGYFLTVVAHCILFLLAGLCPGQSQNLSFNHLTVESGLAGNSVISICQDADGFMWFGTQNNGLSKYNGITFTNYLSTTDTTGLSGNTVSSIIRTSDNQLWLGTSKGINIYNNRQDNFIHVDPAGLSGSNVYCLYEDSDKNIWVGTKTGLYLLKGREPYHFQPVIGPDKQFPHGRTVRCIFEDSNKTLWVGTQNGLVRIRNKQQPSRYEDIAGPDPQNNISGKYITSILEGPDHTLWLGTHDEGLYFFDRAANRFRPFVHPQLTLANNSIRKLATDKDGNLWIATQEGLSVFNGKSKTIQSYTYQPQDGKSISNNSVHHIYKDANQNMWLGTFFGGVNVVYAYNTVFDVYQHNNSGKSISYNVISSIVEDEKQNLWIGTEGGGVNYYDRQTGHFLAYKNNPADKNSLSSNLVKKIYRDRHNNIWIGTSYNKGLNLFDAARKEFRLFTIPQKDATAYDQITAITEDSYGQMWVGAFSGLYTIEKDESGLKTTLHQAAYPLVMDKDVHDLMEDSHKNLWIGTSTGIYVLNPGNRKMQPVKGKEAGNANVNAIIEDKAGNVWIATRNMGIIRCNADYTVTAGYTTADGLPDNNVWGIVEEGEHLWLSTDNGISKFTRPARTFVNYTTSDGLPSNKFNINAFFRDHSGRIFFGSYNGLVSFLPQQIETNHFTGPVKFTDLQLFNNKVSVQDESQLLQSTLTTTRQLVFNNKQNVFTIHFALLNYIKSNKNQYAYKLEGFDKRWNYTQQTAATYTNLPPGNYTFLLKAANNDGIWSPGTLSLAVKVNPPFWLSWWAYTLYIVFLSAILFFFTRFLYIKALFKKEYELQQLKLNFFTNISHEIRTHLTLINAPVERLFQINRTNETAVKMLSHIKRNATQLLELVTELMDFRKAETNNLPLYVSRENLTAFLTDILANFQEPAAQRNIRLELEKPGDVYVFFDPKQMTKVFSNLLYNAFKFTPDNGHIRVVIKDLPGEVSIRIIDNGKGIAKDELEHIFTNYYQTKEDTVAGMGYGIGLALSKMLVTLHKGKLAVESTPAADHHEGYTCFTVTLLKGSAHFSKQMLPEERKAATAWKPFTAIEDETLQEEPAGKKPVVLVVEDNTDVRNFIREALQETYQVAEAGDGQQGLDIAFREMPDLVVSDVMMPGMNGLAFCNTLKTDLRTSHIPVILLTAKSDPVHQVEGFENGADLYVTKPFSLQVLELQIRNLLSARLTMRQKYSRQITLEPQNIELNNTDELFLKELLAFVEEHISDPELGVSLLTDKFGMSKPVLYKKLKALTDMSVHDFIVSIRLKKAALLLQQSQLNVTEIAYSVGYSDRKYFSKEFKKQFGKSPTEFVAGQESKLDAE